MTPTNTLVATLPVLLAADATALANTSALKVVLIAAPFTPGPTTSIADLTPATFTGSTPLSPGTGTQQSYFDPITGRRTVQMKEPAGGWYWRCTATPGATENISGFALVDNAAAVTYGTSLFPQPIPIQAIGDAINIPSITFAFIPPTLS